MDKKGITVFLGAGSTIEIGGPTTAEITQEVKNLKISSDTPFEVNFVSEVAKRLEQYYDSTNINFEEIFHALDQINSYVEAWTPRFNKQKLYSPALAAFVKPIDGEKFLSTHKCQFISGQVIKTVKDLVWMYDSKFSTMEKGFEWYVNFWRTINERLRLDVATLNYDTCIEKILEFNDGFGGEGFENGYHKFQPELLNGNNQNKILHLHGCINYAYPKAGFNINEFRYQELIKYDHYLNTNNGSMRQPENSQSGERRIIGGIITGLDKTDKIQTTPYLFYNAEFIKSVVKNNALLIIGYSFGDKYLNEILLTIDRIHRDNRRIVIITKLDEKYRDNPVENNDLTFNPTLLFMNQILIQEEFTKETKYPHPTISKDGCVRIYMDGFKNAVQENGNEIIEFLNS